jgi:hypothetical protein
MIGWRIVVGRCIPLRGESTRSCRRPDAVAVGGHGAREASTEAELIAWAISASCSQLLRERERGEVRLERERDLKKVERLGGVPAGERYR